MKTTFTVSGDKKSLTVERQFNALQEKVWEAYSHSDKLDQWFAPRGWECTTKEFSFENDGNWVYSLKCVDPEQKDFYGMEMPGMITYDSIDPKDSFGYTDVFLNDKGEVDESMPSSHTELTLEPNGNGTLLSFTTTYASAEALEQVIEMGMEQGLDESFDKLEGFLEAKSKPRIYTMSFASVYPLYVEKAEKKGRTKAEVDEIIRWLTGYAQKQLEKQIDKEVDFETFYAQAPKLNPNRKLITGVICGVRVEDIKESTMQEIRYLDKLVDELARGKKMEKILR